MVSVMTVMSSHLLKTVLCAVIFDQTRISNMSFKVCQPTIRDSFVFRRQQSMAIICSKFNAFLENYARRSLVPSDLKSSRSLISLILHPVNLRAPVVRNWRVCLKGSSNCLWAPKPTVFIKFHNPACLQASGLWLPIYKWCVSNPRCGSTVQCWPPGILYYVGSVQLLTWSSM